MYTQRTDSLYMWVKKYFLRVCVCICQYHNMYTEIFNPQDFGYKDRESDRQNTIGTVVLPIPRGIEDSMAVTWGKNEMNAVQVAMYQAALDGIMAGNPVG